MPKKKKAKKITKKVKVKEKLKDKIIPNKVNTYKTNEEKVKIKKLLNSQQKKKYTILKIMLCIPSMV